MSGAVEGVALSPCPFCGGKADIESQPSYSQAANTHERHRGWCDECGFGLEWHSYKPDAVAAWNKRTRLFDQNKQIALIDAVISMYHTTRLTSDFGEHILSKPIVQRAFCDLATEVKS